MYNDKSSQASAADAQMLEIHEEIAVLQRRLDDMGQDGDCAYERAMARVYAGLVEKRREQLAQLALVR